jgi:hypothetical protein
MNLTITQAININVEELQKYSLVELAELHNFLTTSKQKKAKRKADLVAGLINAKKKEQPKEEKEPVAIENSVKVKPKPKASKKSAGVTEDVEPEKESKPDKSKKVTPKAKPKAEAKAEEKVEPKKPKSLKKDKGEKPDLSKMSQEELVAYVQQLEEKVETFPTVIEGQKTKYVRTEFDNVTDIQKQLMDNPYATFLFADEKIDDNLTSFLVLFASSEVIVLLDRNREKNTTLTIKTDQLDATHIKFNKAGKFEYSFYIREKK